jgi:hypothetical protein
MKCRDVYSLASAYVDRDAKLWQRLMVRLHLRFCDACSAYVDQLRKTVALLRGHGIAPPDATEEDALISALRAGGRGPSAGD